MTNGSVAQTPAPNPPPNVMVKLGNFFFQQRNKLFPLFYVLLFVPSPRLWGDPTVILTLGFLISLVGQVIRVATVGLKYIIRGGRGGRIYADDLVTEGIFSHCRNPLYVGNILMIGGLGVMANSLFFMSVALPAFLFIYVAIVRAEEAYLRESFGDAYDAYAGDVNRWLPRLAGLGATFRSMEFRWRMVLIREYTTTYIWLSGVVLLVMKSFAGAPDPSFYRAQWPWGVYTLAGLFTIYIVIRTLKIRRVITA